MPYMAPSSKWSRPTKGYKIYVRQPGVRNAHEGGIKFYTPHLPRDGTGRLLVTDEQQADFGRAVKATRSRFNRRFSAAAAQ
jgi:hypothetical protein